jgi:hypothetical protein
MSTATCHTTDCAAAGVACTVDPGLLDPGEAILCGTCGQHITDISDSEGSAS